MSGGASFAIDQLETGVAIGVVGLLLAVIQLWLGRRRERIDTTLQLIARLQETEARQMRFRIRASMESPLAKAGRFDEMEPDTRSEFSSIASLFGLAGLLMRHGKLDERLFIEMYGNSVMVNFERLQPYRDWRRDRFGQEDGTAWAHFEYAYQRSARRLKREATSNPIDGSG